MNPKASQSILIFFIAMLVCSITPAMATQTTATNGEHDKIHTESMNDIWNAFNEGSNTKLTPEQDKYLETHQDRILFQAETILYNLQNFLNILLAEYYENNANDEDHTQRKLLENTENKDKYTTDAIKMKNYLSTNKDDPKINNTQTINCNYGTLFNATNETSKEKKYDVDHIIVQIKDPKGYIRYTRLISIDNTYIHLTSGSQDINVTKDKFEELYVWHDDGKYSNPDRMFNIIVSPSSYDYTEHILNHIWSKQNIDLQVKEAKINTVNTVSVTSMGIGGLSVVTAGAYRLCDSCTNKAVQKIEKEIPNVNEIDENTPLMQKDGLKNKCLSYSGNCLCSKCGMSTTILIYGIFIFIGSAITLYHINKLKLAYDDNHKNLNKYEPPLNN